MLGLQLMKKLYIALKTTLEAQLIKNSRDTNLYQKQSNGKIESIHRHYTQEKELVKNDMNAVEDKTSPEYEALMQEYNDLKDEEDAQCSVVEKDATDYEQVMTSENDSIENRLEAIKADLESSKELQKEKVEQEFGYFE